MTARMTNRPIEILLVEDNLGDARLTQEMATDLASRGVAAV